MASPTRRPDPARIGALAVTLGIGAALTTGLGCGVAMADSGRGDDGTRESSRSADANSGSISTTTSQSGRSEQAAAERPRRGLRNAQDSERPRLGPSLRDLTRNLGERGLAERLRSPLRKTLDAAAERVRKHPPEAAELAEKRAGDGDAEPAERLRMRRDRDSVGARSVDPERVDKTPGAAPRRQIPTLEGVRDRIPEVSEVSASVIANLRSDPVRAAITLPANTIAETAPSVTASVTARPAPLLTQVFDMVFRSPASGSAPDEPPSTPLGWAALAFSRREFDPVQRIAALSEVAPAVQVVESAQTITTPVAIAPGIVVPPDLYQHTTVTDGPSLTDVITNVGLAVMKSISEVVGFNISYTISSLMSSSKPPWFTTLGLDVDQSEYTFVNDEGGETTWKVWEIASPNPSGEYVVAVHGGALVNQPNMIQWLDYAAMARDTGATVVVPIFPMVTPEEGGNAATIVPPMADFIAGYVAEHGAENVSVYADSSGGMVAMLAVQKIVRDCEPAGDCATALPSRMVLISPGLGGDDFLNDPNTRLVDDPVSILPEPGEGPDWRGDLPADSPLWNPNNGSAAGLPPTAIYLGTRDILTPSALLFAQRMLDEGSEVQVVLGLGQIHNWAMGGLPSNSQAPLYRQDIYRQLGLLEAAQTTPI